jgi:uncharacterized protein (DUF1800 family)
VLDEPALIRRATERFGFGCRAGELAERQRAGWAAWWDTTFRPSQPGVVDQGAARTPTPVFPPEEGLGRAADPADRKRRNAGRRDDQRAATLWWLDRMVQADDQLTERMVWFWHGHFATSVQKVHQAQLMINQNESLRYAATARFPDLATSMIVDPAMLIWLDGNDNTAAAPNENLSREFLELFLLGRGNYTETDVQEAARALSGWRVNRRTGQARLDPARHDDRPASILGRTDGFDALTFVGHVLEAPASPRFVIGRLWFRLVSATPPDDETMTALVQAWGPRSDVRTTLATMAAQPAFRDPASALVKQPVEWSVGLLRALGVTVSTLPEREQRRLLAGLQGMGQVPFRPPSVGGWPAGGAWLTTSAALSRVVTARAVVTSAALPGELTSAPPAQRAEVVRGMLGVDSWSARTSQAIDQVADDPATAVVVAACSPEYVVSA